MEIFKNKQRKRFPLQRINDNGGIFEIRKCKCSCAGDLEDGNDIMYIGAKKDDNGFMKMVSREENLVTKGNCIIFICDGQGSVGYSNYMDRDFIGSTTLSVGYNKNLNANIGMFLVTLLDLERRKYSYGRKYGTNLRKSEIKLPVDNNGDPDWKFMEKYIGELNNRPITTANQKGVNHELNIKDWEDFRIGKMFGVIRGKRLIAEDREAGNVPYFSASQDNNGQTDSIGNPLFIEQDSLIYDTFGDCYYVKGKFTASDEISILKCRGLNEFNGLFISTIISANKYKYAFGRKAFQNKFIDSTIKLPILRDNTGNAIIDSSKEYNDKGYIPDREFMENYIKNLPYGDRI